MPNPSAQFYRDYGYLVVENFLSEHDAGSEAELMRKARDKQLGESGRYYRDRQVPAAFSQFEAYPHLLTRYRTRVAELLGISTLVEVNSYARIYEHGAVLRKHKDGFQLQHSVTICLSQDDQRWQLCLVDLKGNVVKLSQTVGDALLYYGRLVHWREGPYPGAEQTQVFLHYCDSRFSVKLNLLAALTRVRKKISRRIKRFLPN